MRIAICASDMDERYALARLAEEILLRRGVLPNVVLFPMLPELMESLAHASGRADLAIVADARGAQALANLCTLTPVILVGERQGGPDAFAAGAGYFLERPVDARTLDKALSRCLPHKARAQAK